MGLLHEIQEKRIATFMSQTSSGAPQDATLYHHAIAHLSQDTHLFSSERWLCLWLIDQCLHTPGEEVAMTARAIARACHLAASTVLIGIPKLRDGSHIEAIW